MTVSVVLPSYNHARYVEQALTSVLAQTCAPDEILLVDDGSADGTADIAERFAPRVTVVRREHAGIAPTYNACVELARNPWLAFVETDDALEPDYLEAALGFAAGHPEVAWVSTARRVIDTAGMPTGEIQRKRSPGPYFTTGSLLRRDLGWASTPLVRRDALLDVGPFDGRTYGVDTDMALRFSLRHGMGFLDRPLYLYRRHAANTSVSALRNARAVLQILETFRAEHPEAALRYRARLRRAVARYMSTVGAMTIAAEPGARRRDVLPWIGGALRRDPLRTRDWRRLALVVLFGPRMYAGWRSRRAGGVTP